MPDHIQHPFYPYSFLKNFSVVKPKLAEENNSFNSSVNIFLFSDSLFNNFDGDKFHETTYLFVRLFALNQYVNGKLFY